MKILFFGPNGSGKGTQGSILKKKYGIPHIESGAIFRENIAGGTELGGRAKEYIDCGDLVPDDITIPMILDRLKRSDCAEGWLLDGFPRNKAQAIALCDSLRAADLMLDIVVEIMLDREIAKNRIMGRRLCVNDNNHPNNIFIDAIMPNGDGCRVCGGELKMRADDQDESAINKRHNIYYDDTTGTMASAHYYRDLTVADAPLYITLDGAPDIKAVGDELVAKLE